MSFSIRQYESKFSTFLARCREAENSGLPVVVISRPEDLGDTKEEILESLRRIAEHGLLLEIVDEDDLLSSAL